MTKKKQKYYVVWYGQKPGIYDSWDKCQSQVKNFPNAIYKAFESRAEAEEAFYSGPVKKVKSEKDKPKTNHRSTDQIIANSISVDAACSGNPGVMEYRGVWTDDKTELFRIGPMQQGTNNIGEFLAIVHALALLQKQGDSNTPVYSDSRTAISWVVRKKANTKLPQTARNKDLFDLIRRAETWLKNNQWKNPVIKWETEDWGEIPADFGRK